MRGVARLLASQIFTWVSKEAVASTEPSGLRRPKPCRNLVKGW